MLILFLKGIKMKRVILTLTLMLLCCSITKAADPNQSMTLWITGTNLMYQNTDVDVWGGIRGNLQKGIDIEGGAAFDWRVWNEGDSEEGSQSSFAIGPYGAVHFTDLISIPNPLPFEGMPAELAGEPFFSLEYLWDTDGKGTIFAPAAGVRLFEIFALKYEYRMVQGEKVPDGERLGISAKFNF
jgi:hypothetical protein